MSKLVSPLPYFAISILLYSNHAYAQKNPERQELGQVWIDEQKKNPSIYQSTPVTQVVPNFNTITYALLAETIDTTIKPEDPGYFSAPETQLRVSGYSVAPHVSMSLKKIGLGFATEVGSRTAQFCRPQSSDAPWLCASWSLDPP